MFLLISVRHVGAHPGGHLHGVSIQISINLGKPFFGYLFYEIFLWPESWRESLQIYLLSFPRFWTFSTGFCFLFWSILNGVTLKASNPYWEDYISCCSLKAQPRLSPRLLDLSMIFSVAYKRGKVFCTSEIELTSKYEDGEWCQKRQQANLSNLTDMMDTLSNRTMRNSPRGILLFRIQ